MKEMKWKLNIGETIKDNKRNLLIIDRAFIKKGNLQPNGILAKYNEKWYKYHCNKCGAENWFTENSYKKGKGCYTCCSFSKPILGINTIWDTDRWMCDLGVSEKDAKTHKPCGGGKVEVVCPNCGQKKIMELKTIYKRRTISCICNDKISYPEKFMNCFLKQLNLKFITQLSKTNFEWCENKKYDFYLSDYNIIIETHGEQHYRDKRAWSCSLEEEQRNDKYKMELALKNGIDKYIIVDCRKSELEWIKNSILDSELGDIFDLSNIDWLKCEEFALNNLIKEICIYKKDNPNTSILEIANIFGYERHTIGRWLKRGSLLGWCEYN